MQERTSEIGPVVTAVSWEWLIFHFYYIFLNRYSVPSWAYLISNDIIGKQLQLTMNICCNIRLEFCLVPRPTNSQIKENVTWREKSVRLCKCKYVRLYRKSEELWIPLAAWRVPCSLDVLHRTFIAISCIRTCSDFMSKITLCWLEKTIWWLQTQCYLWQIAM